MFTDKAPRASKTEKSAAPKKSPPQKKQPKKKSDTIDDLVDDLEAVKITEKRSTTPILREKYDLGFPGAEYNRIIGELRRMSTSGEVEGLDEHIAALQSGVVLMAKCEHAANNNGDLKAAVKIVEEAWTEYFLDAFDAIGSARLFPEDEWDSFISDVEDVMNRLVKAVSK